MYLNSCEGIGIGGFIHSYHYFITGRSTSGSDLRKKTSPMGMKKSLRNTEAHQQVLQVVALYFRGTKVYVSWVVSSGSN